VCQYPSKYTTKQHDVSNSLHNPDHSQVNMIMPGVTEQAYNLQEMTPDGDASMLFTDVQWNLDDMTVLGDFMPLTPQSIFPSNGSSSSPASTDLTTASPPSLLPNALHPELQEQSQPFNSQEKQQQQQHQLSNFSIIPAPTSDVRSMMQRPNTSPGSGNSRPPDIIYIEVLPADAASQYPSSFYTPELRVIHK